MATFQGFELLEQGNTSVAPLNMELVWQRACQGEVKGLETAAEPPSPSDFDLYEVADTPTGGDDFAGQGGKMALYFPDTGWDFREKFDGLGDLIHRNPTPDERIYWDATAAEWKKTTDNSTATQT